MRPEQGRLVEGSTPWLSCGPICGARQRRGACRKVCEQVEKWSDWLGLQTGLPSYGAPKIRPHPAKSTTIFKLCDRPSDLGSALRWGTAFFDAAPARLIMRGS